MTASRTWRSRSFRDATISPKLLPANNLARPTGAGQVADERIEAKPALGRAHEALVPNFRPALLNPKGGRRRQRAAEGGNRQTCVGTQREIDVLEFSLLLGEDLLGL